MPIYDSRNMYSGFRLYPRELVVCCDRSSERESVTPSAPGRYIKENARAMREAIANVLQN